MLNIGAISANGEKSKTGWHGPVTFIVMDEDHFLHIISTFSGKKGEKKDKSDVFIPNYCIQCMFEKECRKLRLISGLLFQTHFKNYERSAKCINHLKKRKRVVNVKSKNLFVILHHAISKPFTQDHGKQNGKYIFHLILLLDTRAEVSSVYCRIH